MCDSLGSDRDKIRQAYIQIALNEHPDAFKDIVDIFQQFSE